MMVALQVAQQFLEFLVNVSVLRMLRVLRMVRLLRILRAMRLLPELRTIVASISSSMNALKWTLLLLLATIYIFSVVILQIVTQSECNWRSNVGCEGDEELQHYFSNLLRTILTMFEAIMGGIYWDKVASLLMEHVHPLMGLVFVSYVTISVLAVMNLLTAIFVQHVSKTVSKDQDQDIALKITECIFEEDAGTGYELDLNEFKAKFRKVNGDKFGFREDEVKKVFQLIEADQTPKVSAPQLLDCCLKLRGSAKSIEVAVLQQRLTALHSLIRDLRNTVNCLAPAHAPVGLEQLAMIPEQESPKRSRSGRLDDIASKAGTICSHATIYAKCADLPPLPITHVARAELIDTVLPLADPSIQETLKQMLILATDHAQGGCAFVVASNDGYGALKKARVDMQPVDRDEARGWSKGYMTERLEHIHVSDPSFRDAISEFTVHTDDDRWPQGHEACELPKDGFTALLSPNGYRKMCACRVVGCPMPAHRWEKVGTRHQTALCISYVMRRCISAVVVRSDSRIMTALLWHGGKLDAFQCRVS